jgi:hypothetical protein
MARTPGDSKDPERVRTGRHGGLAGWANTQDRHVRMEHVRENSPANDGYYARQLGFDLHRLTADQRKQIATAKALYFAKLRSESVRAIKRQKAERLRQRAAALDAEAEAGS